MLHDQCSLIFEHMTLMKQFFLVTQTHNLQPVQLKLIWEVSLNE